MNKQEAEKLTGLLIINKPLTWSSMDVIRRVRRLTKIKKVGHAGTLDPLATGVLLVCIGRQATKHIDQLMGQSKEYRTTIDLSATSTTQDKEGEITPSTIEHIPTQEEIHNVLQSFVGKQEQVPPIHSAIKIGGRRAYTFARAHQDITLGARTIEIYSITLVEYHWPNLTIDVHCGKGTYIRSLARDIGKKLNTGGYITQLERTAIGKYTLEKAYDISQLREITPEMIHIIPTDT